jgi:hypothetical protein
VGRTLLSDAVAVAFAFAFAVAVAFAFFLHSIISPAAINNKATSTPASKAAAADKSARPTLISPA